jgi:hypothetical protein
MQRIFALATTLAAPLLLSACLVSDTPLFTAKNARALPIEPASYDACSVEESGEKEDCKVMHVSRNDQGLYKFTLPDENETTLARFKKIGMNAWAAQMWGEGDESYHYFVAERSGAEFSLSMIACDQLPEGLRDRYAANGGMEVGDGANVCTAKSVKAVIAAAKAYRGSEAAKEERLVLTPHEKK